ncbi:GIY-YIG nuclease family protein [Clostridium pasteurianum]|uniref:Bacteriophage T5 Orf172 DNA-binding domain-containing protein n=1 Tax=Clostridium pasteurianum BC1 TaxID=86416 RepID=R4K4A6_CLOPA|nr:GIY-YIG nuclease family protein [Clostridium pasteurianum]AGK95374.1 hypothetical protein Clopa_0312 [Clostridium pasteurianum BC1]
MFKNLRELFSLKKTIEQKKLEIMEKDNYINKVNSQISEIDKLLNDKENLKNSILTEAMEFASKKSHEVIQNISTDIHEIVKQKALKQNELLETETQFEKTTKSLNTSLKKLSKSKTLYSTFNNAIDRFFNAELGDSYKIPKLKLDEAEQLSPTVTLKLHSMDVRELKKKFKENDKLIEEILKKYEARYNTKANITIYRLMVIALRAELQNILSNLKYENLEDSLNSITTMIEKYFIIIGDGNKSIAGTLAKFIGEIELLFKNAVKIEYEYYLKKEKARQEQLAIREQMRQEAEERKRLADQQKQVEKEEEKYNNEIAKLQALMNTTEDISKTNELNAKILELQNYIKELETKKDEIVKLQNGKAGNVYIISNLGSFGDDIFKVGMTRRIDPQERINELSSASVPFSFDVHSFIFSDDAVGLESKLHDILKENRLNRVNMRKEFFKINIDELEKLVADIDPTADFNKTMLAEDFRQSMSVDSILESSEDSYNDLKVNA